MNRSNTVDCQFANLLASLAILFILVVQCGAQSQDQAGTARKATGDDEIIACRFSVLDIYVDVEVKNQKGNGVPNLRMKNFLVYEDGVQQQILSWSRTGAAPNYTHSLYYEPTNLVFDGQRRKVHVEARTNDGRKLRVRYRLRPDTDNEVSFKVGVFPQGYSIRELPPKK
jgi:hypothetical protein